MGKMVNLNSLLTTEADGSKSVCLVFRTHHFQSLRSNAGSYSFFQSCLVCQSVL